ncbi:MAG: ABC transporter permease [Lachnospiraceae bacterium]|nr:ABC transporter permease [Lachnospiraceae bacterium]
MNEQVVMMLLEGIRDTLYMTIGSVLIGYAVGLPFGIGLYVTGKTGLHPQPLFYRAGDFICNIIRSIPFLILLILLIPLTRLIVGKSYGSTATIVPLVICAAPYIARVVEAALQEVDTGVIEAARAMGASTVQIIFKVLLVEARTSLITGFTITTGILLGYSAMSGTVGGGGLGDIAVRYGYYRWQSDIMIITVILLIVIFQIIQMVGMRIATGLDHRKRGGD